MCTANATVRRTLIAHFNAEIFESIEPRKAVPNDLVTEKSKIGHSTCLDRTSAPFGPENALRAARGKRRKCLLAKLDKGGAEQTTPAAGALTRSARLRSEPHDRNEELIIIGELRSDSDVSPSDFKFAFAEEAQRNANN